MGRLFIIPCPQPQEAGAGVGGTACKSSLITPPHRAPHQIRASLLSGGATHQSDPLLLSQVKDDKHKCTLGNLTVPLSILLAEEDMTLTQCFPLRNSGPSSTVKLKMALRVRHKPGCMSDAKGAQIDLFILVLRNGRKSNMQNLMTPRGVALNCNWCQSSPIMCSIEILCSILLLSSYYGGKTWQKTCCRLACSHTGSSSEPP